MTLAMVFPGQGSQSLGMQAGLAEGYDDIRTTYAEASELLGYDLWQIVQEGPAERLDQTVITQPAMLTAGVAAWRAWRKAGGGMPAYMAGHSLGEYTALVCSGSLAFSDAVPLVRRRAELMQAAVPAGEGAMAAILGLDDDSVRQVCADAAEGQVVSAVNFNSPGQVVIAGAKAAVERAADKAKQAGAKRALLLSVSVPSHCALMEPAALQLAAALEDVAFSAPSVPVISNVDVSMYKGETDIREGLTRQLYNPVRWAETVGYLAARGVDTVVECGPGKVLAGLSRRIEKTLSASCIDTPDALQQALQQSADT